MTPLFALFTFLNAWAVSLFLAFPFSIEMPEKREGIDYAAAPRKIHWKRMALIATAIAFVVTLGLAIVMKSGIVPVRNME